MQIGDKVRLHPENSAPGVMHTGEVVYIHPERRYYKVRFTFERFGSVASYHESFMFPEREGDMSRPAELKDKHAEGRGKYSK